MYHKMSLQSWQYPVLSARGSQNSWELGNLVGYHWLLYVQGTVCQWFLIFIHKINVRYFQTHEWPQFLLNSSKPWDTPCKAGAAPLENFLFSLYVQFPCRSSCPVSPLISIAELKNYEVQSWPVADKTFPYWKKAKSVNAFHEPSWKMNQS